MRVGQRHIQRRQGLESASVMGADARDAEHRLAMPSKIRKDSSAAALYSEVSGPSLRSILLAA